MKIEANDLCKIYGSGENRVTALSHASLSLSDGDFLSIMGPSGSGKSTLLHLLSGLDRPTSGSLSYDSRDKLATTSSTGGLILALQRADYLLALKAGVTSIVTVPL